MKRSLSIVTLAVLGAPAAAAPDPKLAATYARLPLAFEEVRGHDASPAEFRARAPGYTLWLTPSEAVVASRAGTLRMQLLDGKPTTGRGEARLPGVVHEYLGNDPSKWHTDATFAEVRYAGVYPGIDLVYHGNQRQLEYDFVVAPGGEPARIGLGFAGAQVRIADDGALVVGDRRWTAPVAYQTVGGKRRVVASRYTVSHGRVGFAVGAYDHRAPLVIDPTYAYSTFAGGDMNDHGYAITVDSSNNAYVTGYTYSTNFAGLATPAVAMDAFVTKFNSTGTATLWTVLLGGMAYDQGTAIALDGGGNVFIAGDTSSSDFPTTLGAYDRNFNGNNDVFVAAFSSGGLLIGSTFLGTTSNEYAHGIAVDDLGRPYVVGETESTVFPTTAGAYDTTYNGGAWDVFVTRFASSLASLSYSTYLGGNSPDYGNGIVLDSYKAYVVGSTTSTNFPITVGAAGGGSDAFVAELNAGGTALLASRQVGGTGSDYGQAIARGDGGQVYITGFTASTNFPTTNGSTLAGSTDAYVTKMTSTLASYTYSMYVGGTTNDWAYGIAVNSAGGAWVTGVTTSTNFPVAGATQAAYGGGGEDAFVVRVQPNGAAINFGTFLGGAGFDMGWGIAVDASDNAYVVGQTSSTGFPVTTGAFDTSSNGGDDAFVTMYNK